jgi:hypothetical protein
LYPTPTLAPKITTCTHSPPTLEKQTDLYPLDNHSETSLYSPTNPPKTKQKWTYIPAPIIPKNKIKYLYQASQPFKKKRPKNKRVFQKFKELKLKPQPSRKEKILYRFPSLHNPPKKLETTSLEAIHTFKTYQDVNVTTPHPCSHTQCELGFTQRVAVVEDDLAKVGVRCV